MLQLFVRTTLLIFVAPLIFVFLTLKKIGSLMHSDKNEATLDDVFARMNRKQRREVLSKALRCDAKNAKQARHARRHGVSLSNYKNEPASLFDAQE